MHDLDQEIRKYSDQKHNLDDVMKALSGPDENITIVDMKNAISMVLPEGSDVYDEAGLDGCTS